jgi:hypothetical protein
MGDFTPVLFNTDSISQVRDDPSFPQNLYERCVSSKNSSLSVRGFKKTFLDTLLAKLGLYRRSPKEKNRYGSTGCAQILRSKGADEARVILCWDYSWWDISDYAWGSDEVLAAAGDRMPNKDLFRTFIDILDKDLNQLKTIYDKVYGGD